MTSAKINLLTSSDIPKIVDAFAKANWPKPASVFAKYLQEQQEGKRIIWVAYFESEIAGYITLAWESKYSPFSSKQIPEIMDLNILPTYRNQGIGSKLLDLAENEAGKKGSFVGLGVGLYGGPDGGYGAAQKLYVARNYVPDGLGVTYNYKTAMPGESYPVDDDLVLWFVKNLE